MEGSKTDAGGLTFGPTWLKQLSGEKIKAIDSDDLSFQLAKHRYERDEMLEVFKRIEKDLLIQENELEKIDDFLQKELQPPVLSTPPSDEEEKALSNCVNSPAALTAFNKAKGASNREEKKQTREAKANQNGRNNARGRDKEVSESSLKKNSDSKNKKEWRNKKESSKKHYEGGRNRENKDNNPEWFNDENEEAEKSDKSLSPKLMTFDENGKFVIEQEKKSPSKFKSQGKDKSFTDVGNDQAEINELNNQLQQTQAQLLMNRMQNSPKTSDHGDKWFYLDSKNQIQGPFSSEQMANWLASGYFSMSLMVKRGYDEKFVPLGLIVQNLNEMRLSSQISKNGNTQPQDQLLKQMQHVNHNNTVLQSHLANQQKSGLQNPNMNSIIQQIQQIQIQQKAAVASLSTLGVNAVAAILQDLRNKQENIISQINITKQNSPIINSILQQSISSTSQNSIGSLANEKPDPLKEKILALFEIKRQEERRKLEEEMRLKQDEEKRRLMEEARIKQLFLMSKMVKQQNLEQQTLDKKLLMEQMRLKEALNGKHNSVLGSFLRQQQQSSPTQLNSLATFEPSNVKAEINNNDLWTDTNKQQKGAKKEDLSSQVNITSLLSGLN